MYHDDSRKKYNILREEQRISDLLNFLSYTKKSKIHKFFDIIDENNAITIIFTTFHTFAIRHEFFKLKQFRIN